MIPPEHCPPSLQRLYEQRLRLAVAALGLIHNRQVVRAGERVGITRPKRRALPFQRLAKERLRFEVTTLVVVQVREVAHTGQGVLVARPELRAQPLQRLAEERLGLIAPAQATVKDGCAAHAYEGIGVARPERCPPSLQHLHKQRLRLAVAALLEVCEGEVVSTSERVGIQRPERLVVRRLGDAVVFGAGRLAVQRLGLGVAALHPVQDGQVLHGIQRVGVRRPGLGMATLGGVQVSQEVHVTQCGAVAWPEHPARPRQSVAPQHDGFGMSIAPASLGHPDTQGFQAGRDVRFGYPHRATREPHPAIRYFGGRTTPADPPQPCPKGGEHGP
jgi:hypothetical protein